MATASIVSSVTAPVVKSSVTGASRDDLEINDVVLLDSANTGTAYAWSLAFTPEGSTAAFSGSVVAKSPGSFTVDKEGPYLVRLQFTDGTGTTEQFVRLRALTVVGGLKLVAAGEGVAAVPVPVDGTAAGWADEQNGNLLGLLALIQKTGSEGRLLYVDSAQGDYTTIQAAMAYAQTQTPTAVAPWVVLVRPGTYTEDLTFYPHVHLFGWPGGQLTQIVRVRNNTSYHTINLPLSADQVHLSNIFFDRTDATTEPVIALSGAGTLTVYRCGVQAAGSGSPQGPAIDMDGTAFLELRDSHLLSNTGASASSFALQVGSGTTATIWDTHFTIRGVRAEEGSTVSIRDSVISVSGSYGIQSEASSLDMDYTVVSGAVTSDMAFNPTGGAVNDDVVAQIRWSTFSGLVFDVTGVTGTTSLTLGSVDHGALSFPGGSPATLAASVPASTISFDNVASGLSATEVQAALDEIWGLAVLVTTLDEAYDGGTPASGSGRIIVADQGAVRIVDAASPSDPIPAANTNGGLEVVGAIKVGAIDKPELDFDPNPYGNGPLILLGREIWANEGALGSSALILANAASFSTYHNYNMRVGSKSAAGGSRVGQVVVRGGDALANLNAGSVYLQAGRGADGVGGDAGSVYLAPGDSVAGADGTIFLVRPEDATPASIQAAGAFAGGVTGTIRFATDMGAIEVDIDAADNLAAVIAKFNATDFVVATDAGGGVILLTSVSRGPMAEVFFLNADTGLDTALGTFAGQIMTQGTYPSFMEIQVTGADEITFGPNAANPMVYNAVTGKLTVPGPLDPTYVIMEDSPPTSWESSKGTLYVGDGTSGSTLGDLYFIHENGGSGGSPINLSQSGTTGLLSGVQLDTFLSSNFTWDGSVSSIALTQTFDTNAALRGLIDLSRNGINDMDNTDPVAPTTDRQFRINGLNLEVGANITADNDVYRLSYPRL